MTTSSIHIAFANGDQGSRSNGAYYAARPAFLIRRVER